MNNHGHKAAKEVDMNLSHDIQRENAPEACSYFSEYPDNKWYMWVGAWIIIILGFPYWFYLMWKVRPHKKEE